MEAAKVAYQLYHALGNAYYKIGDTDRAIDMFMTAKERHRVDAGFIGDVRSGLKSLFGKENSVLKQPKDKDREKKKDSTKGKENKASSSGSTSTTVTTSPRGNKETRSARV
jgi:hypothetical protein